MKAKYNIDLSIITPCFDEEESVNECAAQLRKLMTEQLPYVKYEHIFIDNCSNDKTVENLREIASNDSHIKVIVNSRNIGAQRNIYRALHRAVGELIIPMLPADLQDPVEVIPKMYQKIQQGSLVVFGRRSNRAEGLIMRFLRKLFYRSIRFLSQKNLPLDTGEFMMVDRRIINSILSNHDENPYLRGLIAQTTEKTDFVEYTWVKRKFGKSKASLPVLIDTAINALINTSKLPARVSLIIGFIVSILSTVFSAIYFIIVLFSPSNIGTGVPTVAISIFLFSGFQLFFIGLVGEYVLSVHSQVKKEPLVFDLETINFS